MYHMGRSTVMGHMGATGAEGLLDWPQIQRDTWKVAAQQAFEEGQANGTGSSYPLLDLLYAYLLSDELKRYAMLSGKTPPLVWRTRDWSWTGASSYGGPLNEVKVSDVNPVWINELIDIAAGMAEINDYLRLFNAAGGPAALAGSMAVTKWPGDIQQNVAKVSEIASQMWAGVENTRASGLAEAKRRAGEAGAGKGAVGAYTSSIGAALKETTTQAKEVVVDPALDAAAALLKKGAEGLPNVEVELPWLIPVAVGGLVLYVLAAKKNR